MRYDFGSNYRSIFQSWITHLSPVLWDMILVQVIVAFDRNHSFISSSVRYAFASSCCSILRARITHLSPVQFCDIWYGFKLLEHSLITNHSFISSSVRYDFGSSYRSILRSRITHFIQFSSVRYDLGSSCSILRSRISHIILWGMILVQVVVASLITNQ